MNGKSFNIKTVGIIIIIVFVLLLFFSKSIYNYNLPEVKGILPITGKLNKKERTKGILEHANKRDMYTDVSGKVGQLMVKKGDVVKKGQELMKFTFDIEDIKNSIKEIGVSKSKLAHEASNINIKIENLKRKIALLKEEVYEGEDVSDYDLRQTESQIRIAEKELETQKTLYDAGAATRQELTTKEEELKSLKEKYDNQKEQIELNIKKDDKDVLEKEKSRNKQITEYEESIEELRRNIESNGLDLSKLGIDEAKNNALLQKYQGNISIFAESDGIVLDVKAKVGEFINANQLVISIAEGNTFEIETEIPLDNNFIKVGDKVELSNTMTKVEGNVLSIEPTENNKKVTLSVTSDNIAQGETFDILFKKESTTTYHLVPNKALNKDKDGYYLNQIRRREGLLGKEFYTEKLRVYIGDSDEEYTAIIDGLSFFEPIVVNFTKSFNEKDTIKLSNEGDFFAN